MDASAGISLLCVEQDENHADHHHDEDPHIWLSPDNAIHMAENICAALCSQYPQHADTFENNFRQLSSELKALKNYGNNALSSLKSRKLLTFHDGFSYFAQAYNLTIVHAIEEESGREASAAELIELCNLVRSHDLKAIFTEEHGSTSAASIISRETGVKTFQLDMAMGDRSYFDAMYHNIDTLKEALE